MLLNIENHHLSNHCRRHLDIVYKEEERREKRERKKKEQEKKRDERKKGTKTQNTKTQQTTNNTTHNTHERTTRKTKIYNSPSSFNVVFFSSAVNNGRN